jgi:Protein of unknown function (DUF1640).
MSTAVQFDTFRFVEHLTSAGIPDHHAKAEVEALSEVLREWSASEWPSKHDHRMLQDELHHDIHEVRSDFLNAKAELKQDIHELREELHAVKAELKQDICDLRAELKQDISDLRAELKQDIHQLNLDVTHLKSEFNLMKWLILTTLSGVVTLIIRSFY